MSPKRVTRRQMLQSGTLLALPAVWHGTRPPAAQAAPAASTGLRVGSRMYESIGVRPIINGRGTYTILSGSLMLPEVRAAMDEAAQHYVPLDELAEGIGARLAELTKAEWGMVSSGCAAALTHASAACVAGGNPDLHVRLPDLRGFSKDEAIIPQHSRNVYDAAVRSVGLRVIEVETVEELEAALGPRTAMVYIFAGPWVDESALPTPVITERARARGVPTLVDAAAEILTVPNVHLAAGADLVAYSGGKCIRGPQTAGLLLGREDLVRAAWVQSAPHHGFGRSMKVGKEEAMGMLMAVEMWMQRDHDAEWAQWTTWLGTIAEGVSTVDGVETSVVQPAGLSNHTPTLEVLWDQERFGVSGQELAAVLFDGDPRIAMHTREETEGKTGIAINPHMMSPGDEHVIADELRAALANPPRKEPPNPKPPAVDVTGEWEVEIEFAASRGTHRLFLRQKEHALDGSHRGDFVERALTGTIDGADVEIRSTQTEREGGNSLRYTFTGIVAGDTMSGSLDMGEYLDGRWTARRRAHES